MPSRSKGTLDNYLENRFKLDGNLYHRNLKVQSQLKLINQIYKGNNQQAIFEVDFRDLIWKYEQMNSYTNDSEDSDDQNEEPNYIYRDYKKRKVDKRSQQQQSREGTRSQPSKNITQYNQFWDVFPSRNSFKFSNGVNITSNFDAGNLMECHYIENDQTHYKTMPERAILRCDDVEESNDGEHRPMIHEFESRVCPDGYPYMTFEDDDGREPGFFFSTSGLKNMGKNSKLRFHFPHLSYQRKQIERFGHKPIYLVVSDKEYLNLIQGKDSFYSQNWQRIPELMEFIDEEGKDGVWFECPVPDNLRPSDHIFFAYTYPYNLNDVEYSTKQIQQKCAAHEDKIHFERTKLTESLEGRDIELITLTSKEAYEQQKPVVFLTCRVHCGETPAQYMLQGVFDTLTDFEDRQTKVLLDNYIFKIIPVLNPDGVARGQWRFDTQGANLNRKYLNPTEKKHPSIKAAKEAVLKEYQNGNMKMFMDFHAHSTKRGCFIYGNSMSSHDNEAEAKLLPKLMSLNSVNFDFKSSSFNDERNNTIDWQNEGRSGSSRAAISKLSKGTNPLIYTLEANYARGKNINLLKPRFDMQQRTTLADDNPYIQDCSSELYGSLVQLIEMVKDETQDFDAVVSEVEEEMKHLCSLRRSPAPDFTPEIWSDVGKSVLISLLDYDGINPISRLVSSQSESLSHNVDLIRQKLKDQIIQREQKKINENSTNKLQQDQQETLSQHQQQEQLYSSSLEKDGQRMSILQNKYLSDDVDGSEPK